MGLRFLALYQSGHCNRPSYYTLWPTNESPKTATLIMSQTNFTAKNRTRTPKNRAFFLPGSTLHRTNIRWLLIGRLSDIYRCSRYDGYDSVLYDLDFYF